MYFGNNIVSINCASIDSLISFLNEKSFMVAKSLVWNDLTATNQLTRRGSNHGELK